MAEYGNRSIDRVESGGLVVNVICMAKIGTLCFLVCLLCVCLFVSFCFGFGSIFFRLVWIPSFAFVIATVDVQQNRNTIG